ncbi:MaoC family dehydratase [Acinetobacter bohemicus]|uniref:MaoC family dehydratase n=1 Tax=Acinetobacter lwoffii TaxID=28090 RepID=A0A9D2US85_ACILW|nr:MULTISPECIES: MaoC family dehydratase [Acinetobacter]MCO8042577.1 MaoC family dehydratase [Acinetobacter sp. S4400-12]MCU7224904.1 MaoC family dehydratase [Acinetobacter bohemicus]HJF27773.1 MaoC family dehydratase [Acinetobacter lwoffii]
MFFEFISSNQCLQNNVNYERLYRFRFSKTDIKKFAEVTGDNNPIHLNEDYARTTVFQRPIVHGFYVGSIFSRIFGTDYPGIGTIYLNQSMSFKAPVFIDQTYYAHIIVDQVDKYKGHIKVSTLVTDESGTKVFIGEAILKHSMFCIDI